MSHWFPFVLLFLAFMLGGGCTYIISRLIGIWPDKKKEKG